MHCSCAFGPQVGSAACRVWAVVLFAASALLLGSREVSAGEASANEPDARRLSFKSLVERYKIPCRVPAQPAWQDEDVCGVNCAFALLLLSGVHADYSKLAASAAPVPDGGLSLSEISKLGARFGLELAPLKGTLEDLGQIGPPAIVHLGDSNRAGHFVVFCRYDGKNFEFLDGSSGESIEVGPSRRVTPALFSREMSGYYLVPTAAVNSEGSRGLAIKILQGASAIVWIVVAVLAVLVVRRSRSVRHRRADAS